MGVASKLDVGQEERKDAPWIHGWQRRRNVVRRSSMIRSTRDLEHAEQQGIGSRRMPVHPSTKLTRGSPSLITLHHGLPWFTTADPPSQSGSGGSPTPGAPGAEGRAPPLQPRLVRSQQKGVETGVPSNRTRTRTPS